MATANPQHSRTFALGSVAETHDDREHEAMTTPTPLEPSLHRRARPLLLLLLASTLLAFGCTAYVAPAADNLLQEELARRLPQHLLDELVVPFDVAPEIVEEAAGRVNVAGSDQARSSALVRYVFDDLGLEYSLTPTRIANQTYAAREGNCLSFVNLFVGLGRAYRLNPFYVEVQDYQRWSYQDGVVVSRGHIVAGAYLDGQLSTFDFLPYRPKAYRDFKPIDDYQAMAHFYNNLGAEALMQSRDDEALLYLQIANSLAPTFDKAINNLGIAYRRQGDSERAEEVLRAGLELVPDNVPLLGNLARVLQEKGSLDEAEELFRRLDESNLRNPFYFVYRGELALTRGDQQAALEYMRTAWQADNDLPEVHVGLAKTYLALGKIKEAKHHVKRALTLDATNEEARRYAGLLERGAERSKESPGS